MGKSTLRSSKKPPKQLKKVSDRVFTSKASPATMAVTATKNNSVKETLEVKQGSNDDSAAPKNRKPVFTPIHAVHYAELNTIWPENPRIPSIESRRAWAAARKLDHREVNRWWWKCKQQAHRKRIFVPDDNYELEVGIPPEIPPKVKEEQIDPLFPLHPSSDATLANDNSAMSSTLNGRRVKRPVPLTTRILRSNARIFEVFAPSSSRPSSPTRSSLPPSSPPPDDRRYSSPMATSETLLDLRLGVDDEAASDLVPTTLDETRPETPVPSLTTDLDLCALLDLNPTSDTPADYGFPYVDCPVSLDASCYTFCSPEISSCGVVDMNSRYPTWCCFGFRACFDGSIVGICGCS